MDRELLIKYIEGRATAEERLRVSAWAKADEANRKELFALRKLQDIAIWGAGSKEQGAGKRRTGLVMFRIASAAAMLLLLLGLGIYAYRLKGQIPQMVMQTVNVPAGQRVELILADGTSVWLNAGSKFTFPNNFTSQTREVSLDGEAYFNVKKDKGRAFIVKSSSYNVKVLGTEFNMMAYSRSPLFEVSLLRGSVDVYSDSKKESMRLEPNTRAYLAEESLAKGTIGNYNNFLWKDGLICFDDEPVGNMISKLELYFDTKILVENTSFKTKKYTGKFRTKDGIEHILKVFQLKDKFTYEKDDEKNLIVIK